MKKRTHSEKKVHARKNTTSTFLSKSDIERIMSRSMPVNDNLFARPSDQKITRMRQLQHPNLIERMLDFTLHPSRLVIRKYTHVFVVFASAAFGQDVAVMQDAGIFTIFPNLIRRPF